MCKRESGEERRDKGKGRMTTEIRWKDVDSGKETDKVQWNQLLLDWRERDLGDVAWSDQPKNHAVQLVPQERVHKQTVEQMVVSPVPSHAGVSASVSEVRP